MNTQIKNCACTDCVGASCTCGCQAPAIAASSCQCGCQHGMPCQCGSRDPSARTPFVPMSF